MKVYVKTYGCTFNQRDSDSIKGVLQNDNFTIVDSEDQADIIIVNSCGVKGVTQDKIISYINSQDKKVYVGGCLTKMVDIKAKTKATGVFDTNTISQIGKQIKNGLLENFSHKKEDKLGLPTVSRETTIVPISEGCLGSCTFCSTKMARGNLKSYPVEDIVNAINGELIYLTSQDNGCYGFDIGTNLSFLLKEVVKKEGNFIVRVGMMNPEHILGQLPALIEAFKHPKIKRFLHIPLQSGSNKVLKDMKRKYTVEEFKHIVTEFRKAIPEIHISTDIIVGFPTETEEDFQKTIKVMEELKFEVINLSRFAARPNTLASKRPQLSDNEIKRRSKIINKMIKI